MESDEGPRIRRFLRTATPAWLKQRLLPFEHALSLSATRFCRKHKGRLILDVGCGCVIREGNTFGVDLQISNVRGAPNHVCGNALQLPFASKAFDSILCSAALHHFENPAQALTEMHRALRPGGELLLTVPDQFPKTEQVDDRFRFNETTISALLEETGWKIVECEPIGGRFWTLSRHSLEWLFEWNRGLRLVVFAIAAPVAGVLVPLACFYADSWATHRGRTLGWAIRAQSR